MQLEKAASGDYGYVHRELSAFNVKNSLMSNQ